jgi:hypothetical protein
MMPPVWQLRQVWPRLSSVIELFPAGTVGFLIPVLALSLLCLAVSAIVHPALTPVIQTYLVWMLIVLMLGGFCARPHPRWWLIWLVGTQLWTVGWLAAALWQVLDWAGGCV